MTCNLRSEIISKCQDVKMQHVALNSCPELVRKQLRCIHQEKLHSNIALLAGACDEYCQADINSLLLNFYHFNPPI